MAARCGGGCRSTERGRRRQSPKQRRSALSGVAWAAHDRIVRGQRRARVLEAELGALRASDVVLYGSIAVGAIVGFALTGGAAVGTAVGAVVGLLASRAIEHRHA